MTTQHEETTLANRFHTREGLTEYLRTTIKRPTVLTRSQYDGLTAGDRATYNQQRIDYISGGLTVATPDMTLANKLVGRFKVINTQRPLAANGLIVTGPPTVGKTTILTALMKTTWSKCNKEHSGIHDDRIPVVYIEVPSGSTGRLLMVELASFFGLTVTRADTKDMIERRVISALYAAHTELIVIDELHNLDASNRGNGESIDALKLLRDKVRADFVFAGINLEDSALLTGKRGTQISGRFTQLTVNLFDLGDPESASLWGGVIDAFEKALPLAEHKRGTLTSWVPYLHDRTNGNISSLNMLLAGAALDLILEPDGRSEAITKRLLEEQRIDIAAEQHYKTVRNLIPSRKNKNK